MGTIRDVYLRDVGRAKDPTVAAFLGYAAAKYRQGIIWHARRERDYRRAIWRPWEPIPDYPRDPLWPATPASLFPPGVNPKDYSITPDGRWGSRAQSSGQASSSGQWAPNRAQLITVARASLARIMSGLSGVLAPGKLDMEAATIALRHFGSVDQTHSSHKAAPYL